MTTEGPKKPTGPDPEIQPDAPAPLFRLVPRPRPAPEEAEAEFKRQFGDIPPPTPDMDPPEDLEQRTKVEALRATEATIDLDALEVVMDQVVAPAIEFETGGRRALAVRRPADERRALRPVLMQRQHGKPRNHAREKTGPGGLDHHARAEEVLHV